MLLCASAAAFADGIEAGKIYKIQLGNYAIFPPNAKTAHNSKLVLWTDTRVEAQRWIAEDAGNGYFAFRNVYNNLYLGFLGDKVVMQRATSIKGTGSWKLTPTGDGLYTIVPKAYPAKSMQGPADYAEGTQPIVVADTASAAGANHWLVAEDPTFTSYGEGVRDAMMQGFLDQYYHKADVGYQLAGGGFWGDAEMFETILDAFETTGDPKYRTMFQNLYSNFIKRKGTDWSNNPFNDDITWMVLACIRAYKFFGVTDYLSKAKANYDKMYKRAAVLPMGTLIWNAEANKRGTNSCINCPATVAACYLGELTGDSTYYQKALSIYTGQRFTLFNASDGHVYDCCGWATDSTTTTPNYWASTYNQGTMLGAALMLYKYTHRPMYRVDAERIYQYSIKNLCDKDSIIKVCQTVNGDLCGFKGIFMRYARRYAQELNHPEALHWMQTNAYRARQNANSKGVIWSKWLTKTSEDLIDHNDGDKDINGDAFGASTAVSVAFNAHVNAQFYKDAYAVNPVRYFDEIKWFQLTDSTKTNSGRRGSYLGFYNVNFGTTDGATKVAIRYSTSSVASRLAVYVDSVSATTRVALSGNLETGENNEVRLDLDKTLTGRHHIFIFCDGRGASLVSYQFLNSTGIASLEESQSPLSLRPAEGGVAVSAPAGSRLQCYSLSGQLEHSAKVGTGRISLRPGIHVVKLTSGKNTVTRKIVVE